MKAERIHDLLVWCLGVEGKGYVVVTLRFLGLPVYLREIFVCHEVVFLQIKGWIQIDELRL